MKIELRPNIQESSQSFFGRLDNAVSRVPSNVTDLDLQYPTSYFIMSSSEISAILAKIPRQTTKLHFCVLKADLSPLLRIPENVQTVCITLRNTSSFFESGSDSSPELMEILNAIPHTVKYISIESYNIGTTPRAELYKRARQEAANSAAFVFKYYAALAGLAGGIMLILGLALQPAVAIIGAAMVCASLISLGLFAYKATNPQIEELQSVQAAIS